MKIHNVIQGSEEWRTLRAGIPTASEFDSIVTPSGKPSKSAERYALKLLSERILGRPSDDFMSDWMSRGKEMEADAVDYYELQRNCDTQIIGFLTNDEGTVGCSPDRFVDSDGQVEIKCPKAEHHMAFLMKHGSVYEAHRPQVQGQLWISGREWNDTISFYPGLPYALFRTPRDEAFIKILAEEVGKFVDTLERLTDEAKRNGWLDRPTEPIFSKETDLAYAAWQAGTSN